MPMEAAVDAGPEHPLYGLSLPAPEHPAAGGLGHRGGLRTDKGVVADAAGPKAFLAFLLFAEQSAEGGAGLSDDDLIALAVRAGATGEHVECGIRDRVYEDWTRQIGDATSQAGLTGAPTVLIDGEQLDLRQATPRGLEAAVRAAAAA